MKNNSHFKKCISITCQFLVLLSLSFSSFSQSDYPNRAIKVVVPFAPGSVPESVLRIFTQEMTARFGHPIVIEHKPGASTNIAAAYVANAPADGYTLLLTNLASNILNKSTAVSRWKCNTGLRRVEYRFPIGDCGIPPIL